VGYFAVTFFPALRFTAFLAQRFRELLSWVLKILIVCGCRFFAIDAYCSFIRHQRCKQSDMQNLNEKKYNRDMKTLRGLHFCP
jgi:hypothetical protein